MFSIKYQEISSANLTLNSVWRPLHHVVEDWPLAICDGSTVTYDDLLATDIVREDYEDHVGSNMFALHKDKCHWYYVSRQKPSEAWIFKQFDSDEGVSARCMCIFHMWIFLYRQLYYSLGKY